MGNPPEMRIPAPRIQSLDAQGLRDFWDMYEAHYDELWEALRAEVARHGPADDIPRQAEVTRELRRRAIVDGEWDGLLGYVKELGDRYARQSVPFDSWIYFAGFFRSRLTKALHEAYGTQPQRFLASLEAMNGYQEIIVAAIGEAYVRSMEAIMKDRQERYRELFESANDAVYTIDLEGRITSLNRAAELLMGVKREEAIGRSIRQLIAPDQVDYSVEMLRRKLSGEPRTQYELDIITPAGRRTIEVNTSLITKGGEPVGVQGIARDVTERKEAESAIRQLSTPVLEVRHRLLILPLVGRLDTQRARQLTGQLLAAVREQRALAVVIDLTGVAGIDQDVASRLQHTIAAVRLLGATTILSGISRQTAEALHAIEFNIGDIRTVTNLRAGIEAAEEMLAGRAPSR